MEKQDLETTQEVETTSETMEVEMPNVDNIHEVFIKDKNKKFYICNIKTGVIECLTKLELIKAKLNVGGTPDNELQFTYRDIYERYKQGFEVKFSRTFMNSEGVEVTEPCNYTVPSEQYSRKHNKPESELKGFQKTKQVVNHIKIRDGKKDEGVWYTTKSGQLKKRYKKEKLLNPKVITHKKI